VEHIHPYNNYPKEIGGRILSKWKDYRELFGFEADVYKNLRLKGYTEEQISSKIKERANLIDEIWRKKQ
jgi:hypothetical protein